MFGSATSVDSLFQKVLNRLLMNLGPLGSLAVLKTEIVVSL